MTVRPLTRTTLYERLRKRSYRAIGKTFTVIDGDRREPVRVFWNRDLHEAYLQGVRDAIRAVRLEGHSIRVNRA